MTVKQLHADIDAVNRYRWLLADLVAQERMESRLWAQDSLYCRAAGLNIGGVYTPDEGLARRIRRAKLDLADARRRYEKHSTR